MEYVQGWGFRTEPSASRRLGAPEGCKEARGLVRAVLHIGLYEASFSFVSLCQNLQHTMLLWWPKCVMPVLVLLLCFKPFDSCLGTRSDILRAQTEDAMLSYSHIFP